MRFPRRSLACIAVVAACAVAAPAAGAQVVPDGGWGGTAVGPCGTAPNGPNAGQTGVQFQNCPGVGGLVFNGPSIGRLSSVVGPTIISPGFAGVIGVSAGSVYIGPGAGGEAVGP
jgi:hypothetical protein